MTEQTIIHETSEPHKAQREAVNILLKDRFGIDTLSGLPMWRVAWAQDHYEKKFGTYRDITATGIFLREVTEVREVPKYPYLRGKYILEHLLLVPTQNRIELVAADLSYEGIYPFQHKITEAPLPPKWEMVEYVIDCINAAMGASSMHKYVSADEGDINGLETKRKRIDDIYQYLYGNETTVTDHLADKTGVTVPNKQFIG